MPHPLPRSVTPSYPIRTLVFIIIFFKGSLPPCCRFCSPRLHPSSPPASGGNLLATAWLVPKQGGREAGGFARTHLGHLPPGAPRLTGLSLLASSSSELALLQKPNWGLWLRRKGSGKRAGPPCPGWTRPFSGTPRDSPLLAQVETSQPFPRHPTPRTRSHV